MIRTVALWAALILQTVSGKPATASIQGVVVADETGAPLAGAHVTFYREPGPDEQSPVRITTRTSGDGREPAEAGTLVITDSRGAFEFKNLEAGSYSLSAQRNGYQYAFLDKGDTPVLAGQILRDLVIRMTSAAAVTGKISGQILNESGRPVPLVRVLLMKRGYDSNGNRTLEESATTQTNDLGEYRMHGIEPGRYYVVCDGDIRNWNGNENAARSNYTTSFYPGVVDIANASTIDVKRNSEVARVNFQMRQTALYRIRGRLVDSATGQPPAQATLDLSNPGLIGNRQTRMSYNPADGSFTSPDLPPGTYIVDSYQNGKGDEDTAPRAHAVVTLGNASLDGLLLKLIPPPSISGRIVVEGELPKQSTLESSGTRIELLPAGELESLTYGNSRFVTYLKEEGMFTLWGVPEGEFRVSLTWPPPDFYIREARLDGADVLTQSRTFSSATRLDIVLAKGGQLEGVVRNESLHPVANAWAVLVPAARTRNELYKRSTTTADGHFVFQGVSPGDYKVFAWEGLEDYFYFDPNFLKEFETLGQPVRITDSSKKTVDVKIIPRQTAQ